MTRYKTQTVAETWILKKKKSLKGKLLRLCSLNDTEFLTNFLDNSILTIQGNVFILR